jgi:hypothetical protein
MPQEAKRKFLKVDVGEVSLVDEPANETPIAVMKRKETNMTTPAEATNQEVPAAEQSGDTSTPVAKSQESSDEETEEVTVDASEDVIKRLTTAVEALVEKNTEPTEVEGASEDEVEKAKGKTDEEKAKKAAALTASLKKAGLAEAAIKTALSAAGLGGTTSTQKSADEAPAVEKQEAAMDTLEALGELITKAKSFTPSRLAELQVASEKITGLLAEINGETEVKKAAEVAEVVEEAPATTEADVEKSKTPDMTDAVQAAVAKALAPIMEQLETIKKTRTPSTAAPAGESTPEPTEGTEVSVEKNFWSGVF